MSASGPTRLLLVVAAVLVVASWPVRAGADATVVSSTPAPGSELSSAPGHVDLFFSETLNQSLSNAEVVAPNGHRSASTQEGDAELTVALIDGGRGVYAVDWIAVSAVDGHVLRGAFHFGVGVLPGQDSTLERTGPSPTDIAVAALRWFEYLGLLGAVGAMVVRRLAANPPRIRWARLPMEPALAAAFVGGLGVIAAEALNASGSLSGAITFLLGGPPGWVRVGRVAAEGVALVFCLRGVRFVAVPALLAVVAVALAGHAAGVRPAAGVIFTDALHVLSAGAWAGGILVMATLRPPGGWRGEEARALLDRFGRVALLAFALTALTGALSATAELTAVGDLWATSYGVVLSVKTAGVIAMLVLSALVWRRRISFARAEAVVVVVVVAATAVLAAYPLPPARVADANATREVNTNPPSVALGR